MVRQFRYRQRSRRTVQARRKVNAGIVQRAMDRFDRRIIDGTREKPMCRPPVSPSAALRASTARERVASIADPGSIAPVNDLLAAPRLSPHLAGWRLTAQADDG